MPFIKIVGEENGCLKIEDMWILFYQKYKKEIFKLKLKHYSII